MSQYDFNLRDYHRILRRRWKVIAFATFLVVIFSYFFGKSRLPLYQTYSSVKIEETNTVAGLLVQKLTYTRWDNIATAQELVNSFPMMEIAAKRMGLIDKKITSKEIRQDLKLAGLINRLLEKVHTERSGKTNIIDIHVTSDNPYEAREIAQTLADVFAEEHLEMRSRQDRETRVFIENQLSISKAELSAAERVLQNFRETNPYPVIDDHVLSTIDHSNALETELRKLNGKIEELEIQNKQLKKRSKSAPTDTMFKSEMFLGDISDKIALTDVPKNINMDWISSSEGFGPLGLLNDKLINLEMSKRELLRKYKPSFPAISDTENEIKELVGELITEVDGNIEYKISQRDSLNKKIKEIQWVLDKIPSTQRVFAQLLREVELKEEQYAFLSEKLQEAMIREADQADEVMVVRPAMLNTRPININMFRTVSVGLVIGMMLGLVLAFLFETFDTSIGTIEDVEEYLSVPVMGVIPHIDLETVTEKLIEQNPALVENKFLTSSARLVTHFAPKDPVAEAYRSLRTTLQFRSISRTVKTIVATSAALQEGKSTTLVNLAITMAQSGTKVLLVGCNLRRPTLYRIFGLEQSPGVTDIVLGRRNWRDTVRTVTDIIMGEMGMESILMTPGMENLHIITSGGIPPNPSEMLASKNMKSFMDEAREEFDVILFDVPPILPVTDAAVLSNRADATLLIYRTGKVPRAALKRAKVQIESVGATVLGVVLNDLKADITGFTGSHYYYGRYYGRPDSVQGGVMSEQEMKSKDKLVNRLKEKVSLFTSAFTSKR